MAHCDTFCYNGFINLLSRHTKVYPEERVFGCEHSTLKLPGHHGVCGEKLTEPFSPRKPTAHICSFWTRPWNIWMVGLELVVPVGGTLKLSAQP